MVGLNLGAREAGDWRWIISVRGVETLTLILADQTSGEEVGASSAADVLKLLEELRCS